MNEFGIMPMTNGAFDIFGSPIAGPFSQGAMLPGSQGTEDGFVDLLSMVEDMSIPESQAGQLEESIELEVDLKKDTELTQLKQQWGSGVMMDSASVINQNALTEAKVKPEIQNLLTQKPVEASVLNLSLLSGELPAVQAKQEALLVEPWALAIETGDLKQVAVEDIKISKAEQSILNQAKSSIASVDIAKSNKATSADLLGDLEVERPLRQPKAANVESFKTTPELFQAIDIKNVDKVKSTVPVNPDEPSEDLQSPERKVSSKNSVQDGASFILDHVAASGSASAVGVSLKTTSLLKDKHNLGVPTDNRISAESLNFVSQHVDMLKAKGGGQMRVDLHPSELGSIEITVKKEGKTMSVEIKVEKPDTLKLLNEQRDVLSNTLNRQSKTELTLESKSIPNNSAERLPGAHERMSSLDHIVNHRVESSLDRLEAMNSMSADIAEVPMNMNKEFSSNSSNSGQGEERQASTSFAKNFDRESSRDSAMSKWEKLWKEKQSA